MNLTGMVVDDGDDVSASGVVLAAPSDAPGRLLLVPRYLTVTLTDIPEKAVLAVAAGRLPEPGTPVEVTGAVMGEVLYPHSVTRFSEETDAVIPASLVAAASSPELQHVLGALVDAGVLTTFWLDQAAGVFWATAIDSRRAWRELAPVAPGTLRVVESRWTHAEINAAAVALDALPPEAVLSRGEAHGEDHQLRLRVTLRGVTRRIAAILNDVPDGLLEVVALVRPTKG